MHWAQWVKTVFALSISVLSGHWLPTGGPTPPPVIALTFDDGPAPTATPAILATLSRYHAHATFFVLGSEVQQFPQLAHAIQAQGSVLANHGYDHLNYFHVGLARMWSDAQKTADLLRTLHLSAAPFYRPPYGNSNARLIEWFHAHGYTTTLWSIDTRDWAEPGTHAIISKILANAKPGAIILMHDGGGNRQQTVTALNAVIKTLEPAGYQFVTLPDYLRALKIATPPAVLPIPPTPHPSPPSS